MRWLITILCLIGAIVLYMMGLAHAAVGTFILGGILELIFWVRLLGGTHREPKVAGE